MQGLAHYNEHSPTPSPPPSAAPLPGASSSRGGKKRPIDSRRGDDRADAGASGALHQSPSLKRPSGSTSIASEVEVPQAGPSRIPIEGAFGSKAKRRKTSSTPASGPGTPLPENLTHTRQSDLPHSELAGTRVSRDEAQAEEGYLPGYPGLSEDEVFRLATRPLDIAGVVDWGIPSAVDSSLASDALTAKVANFLALKYEKYQHINTTLLSSSAFANPHIYSKLVEFVRINETDTAFPGGGWVTRRGLEGERATYGPAALNAAQKAKEEAVRRSQEVGKRSTIEFARGKHRDGDRDRDRDRRDRDRDKYRDRDRERERDRNGGGRERDRHRR